MTDDVAALIRQLGPPYDGRAGAIAPRELLATVRSGGTAFECAVGLFNAGYFWETHEVLEAVWLKASPNSGDWYLLRAIIQLANAGWKFRLVRHDAARRLMLEVAVLLASADGATTYEVDVAGLRLDVERVKQMPLAAGTSFRLEHVISLRVVDRSVEPVGGPNRC